MTHWCKVLVWRLQGHEFKPDAPYGLGWSQQFCHLLRHSSKKGPWKWFKEMYVWCKHEALRLMPSAKHTKTILTGPQNKVCWWVIFILKYITKQQRVCSQRILMSNLKSAARNYRNYGTCLAHHWPQFNSEHHIRSRPTPAKNMWPISPPSTPPK